MCKKTFVFILLVMLQGCLTKTTNTENPNDVARSYCNCTDSELSNAKDSSVNLNDYEIKIYKESRLMTIYANFNDRGKYSKPTLDSASKFANDVLNIEDTLCYNKIDLKKIKKIPHIKMSVNCPYSIL